MHGQTNIKLFGRSISDDEMVGARGINIREEKMHTATRWENLKVKDHLVDLRAEARNI